MNEGRRAGRRAVIQVTARFVAQGPQRVAGLRIEAAPKIVRVVEIAAGDDHDFVGGGHAAETGARERFSPERFFGQTVGQKSDPAGAVFAVPAGPGRMVS